MLSSRLEHLYALLRSVCFSWLAWVVDKSITSLYSYGKRCILTTFLIFVHTPILGSCLRWHAPCVGTTSNRVFDTKAPFWFGSRAIIRPSWHSWWFCLIWCRLCRYGSSECAASSCIATRSKNKAMLQFENVLKCTFRVTGTSRSTYLSCENSSKRRSNCSDQTHVLSPCTFHTTSIA